MENEIMNYEEEVMVPAMSEIDEVECGEGKSGLGTLIAMGVGAVCTVGGIWIGKQVKKLVAKHKAKKELRQPDESEVVEPTDEQIMEVAK